MYGAKKDSAPRLASWIRNMEVMSSGGVCGARYRSRNKECIGALKWTDSREKVRLYGTVPISSFSAMSSDAYSAVPPNSSSCISTLSKPFPCNLTQSRNALLLLFTSSLLQSLESLETPSMLDSRPQVSLKDWFWLSSDALRRTSYQNAHEKATNTKYRDISLHQAAHGLERHGDMKIELNDQNDLDFFSKF